MTSLSILASHDELVRCTNVLVNGSCEEGKFTTPFSLDACSARIVELGSQFFITYVSPYRFLFVLRYRLRRPVDNIVRPLFFIDGFF